MKLNYYGDNILTTPTSLVTKFDDDLKSIINQMYRVMTQEEGCGLAANQVGLNSSFFVSTRVGTIINPQILEQEGTQSLKNGEGCLSFPGLTVKVERPKIIRVRFLDGDFNEREEVFKDFDAIVFSHENEHLLGKTFLDYVGPVKRGLLEKKIKKWRREREIRG